MYGGRTDYLEDGSSGLGTLVVDWKDSDGKFGYFGVYSSGQADGCVDKSYIDSKGYGSGKTKNFSTSNWSELPDRQEYLDQKSIKLPPN